MVCILIFIGTVMNTVYHKQFYHKIGKYSKHSKISNIFSFCSQNVSYQSWNSQNASQNGKQGRLCSDCFFKSSLIWVCIVCLDLFKAGNFLWWSNFRNLTVVPNQLLAVYFWFISLMTIKIKRMGMVNVLKFQTLFSVCSQIKFWLLVLEFTKFTDWFISLITTLFSFSSQIKCLTGLELTKCLSE